MERKIRKLPLSPALLPSARGSRSIPRDSALLLWGQFRRKQFKGYAFKPQKIIGDQVVDFYCPDCNVVIEIDDDEKAAKKLQKYQQDLMLRGYGLSVIHLPEREIKEDLDGVMRRLEKHPALCK